jgi:hypothetical protein
MRSATQRLLLATLATLTIATAVQAADLVKPNIKPGLWEVTSHPQMSGQMPIPEEQLAKLTPEQRARMEAAIKASMANSAKPRVYKECMTPEKIARGFDIDQQDKKSCTRKVISSSASEVTLHDECKQQDATSVSDVHFEVKGGTQMAGKINVVMTSTAGKTMTIKTTVDGKWLGADCGSVKDSEKED